jgi:hypothetical protein
MIHEQGLIMTELDANKGVWCEICTLSNRGKLITLTSRKAGSDFYQHICIPCARDLSACLQKSLMDSLLTGE